MKKLSFWLSSFLILACWPISFYLANRGSWLTYFLALSVVVIDWVLYSKKIRFHYFLYLLLPVLHPAYLAFPIFALLFNLKEPKKPAFILYVTLTMTISVLFWKPFYTQSIFMPDPLAFDTLSKKISLIPNRNLARIYENKATIFQDKYKSNIFTSFDLNNYFFSLHPQELGNNQNLNKYPYLAIIPFLLGLYFILENKQKKWIIGTFLTTIVSIAFVNNPDKLDLLVFLPVSLICLSGLKQLSEMRTIYSWIFIFFFIPISLIELLRIITVNR